jgi:hypothetical protein
MGTFLSFPYDGGSKVLSARLDLNSVGLIPRCDKQRQTPEELRFSFQLIRFLETWYLKRIKGFNICSQIIICIRLTIPSWQQTRQHTHTLPLSKAGKVYLHSQSKCLNVLVNQQLSS